RRASRAASAASLVVLATTLTLTFTRGSWLALLAGLVALLVLEPRRLERLPRLAAAVPAPALAVWIVMTSAALARADAPAPAVKSQEHRLAAVLIGLVVLAAALALAADRIRAPRVGRNLAVALMTSALVLVLAAAVVVVVRAGGPEGAVHRALAAFRTGDTGGGSHVFSASG